VQDAVEFFMLLMVPTQKNLTIKSYHDLIPKGKFELPEWMEPLIRVSYFIHFFRGEMRLPMAILTEIHDQTKANMIKYHFDNIIVIRKVPSTNSVYTREWIVKRIFDLIKTHKVRIIDPQRDITFIPDEDDPEKYHSIVIIFDGFSHMREND